MSSSSAFADHHHHQQLYTHNPSDQLCYVKCDNCDTVLAVSVPSTSLFKTVAVRCGHCSNLLTVTMRGYVLPSVNLGHSFFPPAAQNNHQLLPEEDQISRVSPSNMLLNPNMPLNVMDDLPKPPSLPNRPPEKRQRVPSAYNRFIKDEIQRIKAGNPDISHREAFSAAAKNWAHFPHIQFGLMSDQPVKKQNVLQQQQEGDDGVMNMKDYNISGGGGFLAAAPAHVGLSPY